MRLLFKYDKEWTLYPWRCSLTTKGEHTTRNKQTLLLLTCIFHHYDYSGRFLKDYYHILPQNIILSEYRVLDRDVKHFLQISDVVHFILVVGLCSWAQLPATGPEMSPRSTETARVSSKVTVGDSVPEAARGYPGHQRLFSLARGRMRRCEAASGKAFREVHYEDLNETGNRT